MVRVNNEWNEVLVQVIELHDWSHIFPRIVTGKVLGGEKGAERKTERKNSLKCKDSLSTNMKGAEGSQPFFFSNIQRTYFFTFAKEKPAFLSMHLHSPLPFISFSVFSHLDEKDHCCNDDYNGCPFPIPRRHHTSS